MASSSVVRAEAFERLKIAVRERPLSEDEKSQVQVMLRTDNDKLIAFYPDSKEGLLYNYDYFYPEEATQLDLFQTIGFEMVDLVMGGYSASCVAFGPSAAGKTHTLFGSDQEPGLIHLTTKELFHRMETQAATSAFTVRFSYWEMSCDNMRDVLTDATDAHLHVMRGKHGVEVQGLTQVEIASWEELDEQLMQGNIRRIRLTEERNARWHGFVKLYIESHARHGADSKVSCTMTFAHLKGADRVGMKGAKGEVLKQGSNINKSVSLLCSAILHSVDFRRKKMGAVSDAASHRELIEKSQSFFMESKFTQVLSQCVCGLEAAFLIGNVCTLDYHETTDTLENLQNAQQLTACLARREELTREGKLRQQLAREEAVLTPSPLAPGHPLTEIEERVERLRAKLSGAGPHSSESPSAERSSAARPASIPPPAIPGDIQKWKQSVLMSKMHGDRATIYVPTGSGKNTYKGQWAKGRKEGFGEHITPTTKYCGNWKGGMRDGEGTLWVRKDSNSEWVRVYKGQWKEDRKHGRGINWYANGDVYDGFFDNGVRSTIGALFLTNGDRVEGQFKNDMIDGWATLHCKNGDWFEGHWAENLREGPGIWYYESRKQCYRGEWHKNVPRCGTIEDMPEKESSSVSSFLPRVELRDFRGVLDKEKRALDERRRLDYERRGLQWEPVQFDDEAASEEQVSW